MILEGLMTKRQQICGYGVVCAIIATTLLGCAAQPPRPAGTQRAPVISQPLTAAPSGVNGEGIATAASLPASSDSTSAAANQYAIKVGLLLPLTGRNAQLGKALQDAAAISLFDKYARLSINQQTTRVVLLPKDTGDMPEQASRAMSEALADGAQFIIGPVFADATAASAGLAKAKNINVLSLSNNRTQNNAGTYTGTYMFGFSPAEQVERVMSYAFANNKTKIAVLVPDSALGETVLNAARNTAKNQGFALAGEAKYSAQGAGVDTALNLLAPAGQPLKFDAILIPESGAPLGTIMRGLSIRTVKPSTVQFLGTGLWDDTELLRRVNLDGAWFASSSPERTSQFENRFRATYNYTPPRIASLSYDAVALAITLATSGRSFDNTALTNPAGFMGPANGIFRFQANGMAQRGLAVMQVEGSAPKVISPAPSRF